MGDETRLDTERPGDWDEGRSAALEYIGERLAPEGDEGHESWGIEDVASYVVTDMPDFLGLSSYVPPRVLTIGHVRGAAQFLRDLADHLDGLAEAAATPEST